MRSGTSPRHPSRVPLGLRFWEGERCDRLGSILDGSEAVACRVHHATPRMMNQNRLRATADWLCTSYLYDALGRRVSKGDYNYYDYGYSPSETYGPEGRIYWVYDGWNLVGEYSGDYHASGTPPAVTLQKTWLWGSDLSGSLQGAGGVGGLLGTKLGTGSPVYYPLFDGNGNVGQYIDGSGSAVARYEYEGFGAIRVMAGTLSGSFPITFSTKYFDSWSETYYYGYRDYDPFTGRWLSRDPIGERGGVNLYGFVFNNPANDIDLLGEMSYDEAMIAGSNDAIKQTMASENPAIGAISRREYCGLVCRCRDEFKPTPAHSGADPVLREIEILEDYIVNNKKHHRFKKMWIKTSPVGCDPLGASCKQFGNGWKPAGAYHSHPENTDFSHIDDEGYIELGYGLGKVTPDGKIEVLTEGGKRRILRLPDQPHF